MIGERLALIYAQTHPHDFQEFVGEHAGELAEDADGLVCRNRLARELLESDEDGACRKRKQAVAEPATRSGRQLRERLLRLDPDLGQAIRMNRKQIDSLTERQAAQVEETYRLARPFINQVPDGQREHGRRFLLTRLLWDVTGVDPDPQAAYRHAVARFVGTRRDTVDAFFAARGMDPDPVLRWAWEADHLLVGVHRLVNPGPAGESSC